MNTKRIKNPWHDPWNELSKTHYEVPEEPCDVIGELEFYSLPCSVLCVLNGVAITECVTVRGALRSMRDKALLALEEED